MLTDRRHEVAKAAKAAAKRYETNSAMGDFIAQLAPWSWWATFTFRRRPTRAYALSTVRCFFEELQAAAGSAIGWVIVEDYGAEGRLHFHALIAGVDHLPRELWQQRANQLVGDSAISAYDPGRGAAHYIAGKAMSEDRLLEFGGGLLNKSGGHTAFRNVGGHDTRCRDQRKCASRRAPRGW